MRSVAVVLGALGVGVGAQGAVFSASSPADLDLLMGSALFDVPWDGTGVGTIYGHAPSLTPGLPLPTPIGDMGFMPSHDRVAIGGPTSSGTFHAIPPGATGTTAGSDVIPPLGATAIDFFIAGSGASHSFEITAVGTVSSHTIIVPAAPPFVPVYVGFGATGETLLDISIVKLPFPSPTAITWEVSEIRVLPTPGTLALLAPVGVLGVRRRR